MKIALLLYSFILDLLYQSFNEDWLEGEVGHCYGPKLEVKCTLFCDKRVSSAHALALTVQPFSTPRMETGPYQATTLDGMTSSGPIWGTSLIHRFAIVPDSIPSVEELLGWVTIQEPGCRLIYSLAAFVGAYCEQVPQLPLVSLPPGPSSIDSIFDTLYSTVFLVNR